MTTPEQLSDWDKKIVELVQRFQLEPYVQEFEICDHFEMLGYMSYSGMPSRYPHWSFGKSYEREKTMYDYGVGGLPYEMVINSNPCLAYLMRDNTELLQVLTIAHVYGHNDFFANNFTFTSGTRAEFALEMFRNHGDRIRSYMEDPSIGVERVEDILDAAHSLSLQRNNNLALTSETENETKIRLLNEAQVGNDKYDNIQRKREYKTPDLSSFPIKPERNLLRFIADNHPHLESWQRDVISIVDEEAKYFMPQIETKIMNEGWASYWHHKILNHLNLPQGMFMEFMVRHNQVLRPHPGGINPYHLGFILLQDIERRWNEEAGITQADVENLSPEEHVKTPGRQKIFQIRSSDRDTAFIRRFLSEEMMRELDFFQHEKRGKDRVITKVSDEDNWENVKQAMIKNIGSASIPVLQITDADFLGKRGLYVKHEHDGRDLQLEYAQASLKHLEQLWGKEVTLETIVNGRPSRLVLVDGTLKIERI